MRGQFGAVRCGLGLVFVWSGQALIFSSTALHTYKRDILYLRANEHKITYFW